MNRQYAAIEALRSTPSYIVRNYMNITFIKGKEKVTGRFEAAKGYSIAWVFGIRMIRRDTDD